jgi:hypothetical protein
MVLARGVGGDGGVRGVDGIGDVGGGDVGGGDVDGIGDGDDVRGVGGGDGVDGGATENTAADTSSSSIRLHSPSMIDNVY